MNQWQDGAHWRKVRDDLNILTWLLAETKWIIENHLQPQEPEKVP